MVTVTKRIQQQPRHNTQPPQPIPDPDNLKIMREVIINMPNDNKPKIFLYRANEETCQVPTRHNNTTVLHKETCQEVILRLILLLLEEVKDFKDKLEVVKVVKDPTIQHWEGNVPLTTWPTSTTSTMANAVQCLAIAVAKVKDKTNPKKDGLETLVKNHEARDPLVVFQPKMTAKSRWIKL